jgi:hypothetical protein
MPVVGFLHSAAAHEIGDLVAAFLKGVQESGFHRRPERRDRVPLRRKRARFLGVLAEELVARKVDVIATGGGDRTAIAAKQKTSEISVVSLIGGDPVAEGPSSEPRTPWRQSYRGRLSHREPDNEVPRTPWSLLLRRKTVALLAN